jgi:hypothetical protein
MSHHPPPIPHCGYRGVFGGCMASPGYSCTTVRGLGDCLKEREQGFARQQAR